MSQSPPALVDRETLVWARETAGFDIPSAAKKMGIRPERLEEWEQDVSHPSIKQLRRMAKVYQRPIGLFFCQNCQKRPRPLRTFVDCQLLQSE